MASDTQNGNHAPRRQSCSSESCAQELGHLRSVATGSDDDSKTEGMNSAVSIRMRIRIIEAERSARRINTKRTLASVLLGKGSRAESKLFNLAVKDRWAGRILWTLWWLGAVSGMLALVHVGPSFMAFFSVFMLPLPIFSLSMLSLDLVWEVLQCSECYLITGLQVVTVFGGIALLRDRRAVFWVFSFPTMISASLVDAYPAKFRSIFAKLFFTSLGIVYLVWLSFLFFGWMDPVFNREWKNGELSGKAVSSSAQNTMTVLAFCGKQLASAVLRPDNFVVIKIPLRSRRVHVEPEFEMKDGVWKPTGKFVAETKTQLEMTPEEMDTFNCKEKFRTSIRSEDPVPVASKSGGGLYRYRLRDAVRALLEGSFNWLPSVTSRATEGTFAGPDDAATCVTAVATDGRDQTVLEMGVQTNITIPWDYFQDIALCKPQALIEDVDTNTRRLVPKAQQVQSQQDSTAIVPRRTTTEPVREEQLVSVSEVEKVKEELASQICQQQEAIEKLYRMMQAERSGQEAGVTAVPDVMTIDIKEHKESNFEVCVLLCSDGVWEFIKSDEALDILKTEFELTGGPGFAAITQVNSNRGHKTAANRLARKSWEKWRKDSGQQISDNFTVMILGVKSRRVVQASSIVTV